MDWDRLANWLKRETGISLKKDSRKSVSGGCINDAFLFEKEGQGFVFIKINAADCLDLFEVETTGLNLLRETKTIRVPEAIGFGIVDDRAVLVLEGIKLHHWQDAEHQARLGTSLAELHETVSPDGLFGASFNNHIGRTPQRNDPSANWGEFFIAHRLDYQFQLASKNGWNFSGRGELFETVRAELTGIEPPSPALLHGDLWSGNVAFDKYGAPVIFDPACYYGDGEAEIAFTGMFGGFSPAFYRAYREIHPAPPNKEWLHRLYNLYHELNHFNLFGGGYKQQSEATIRYLMK